MMAGSPSAATNIFKVPKKDHRQSPQKNVIILKVFQKHLQSPPKKIIFQVFQKVLQCPQKKTSSFKSSKRSLQSFQKYHLPSLPKNLQSPQKKIIFQVFQKRLQTPPKRSSSKSFENIFNVLQLHGIDTIQLSSKIFQVFHKHLQSPQKKINFQAFQNIFKILQKSSSSKSLKNLQSKKDHLLSLSKHLQKVISPMVCPARHAAGRLVYKVPSMWYGVHIVPSAACRWWPLFFCSAPCNWMASVHIVPSAM